MMRALLAAMLVIACIGSAAAQTPPAQSSAKPFAETWLPRTTADLAGLDKITARLTPLSVNVGETVSFGSLRVTLRSCVVRGPDQPADQAAYLDVTDTKAVMFGFHGWMLLSDPAIAVLEHAVYDVKLVGCR